MTDRHIVGEMSKLPIAGEEVGIFLIGQRVKIFSVARTQPSFSPIYGCCQLVTAIFPLLLPGHLATEGDV